MITLVSSRRRMLECWSSCPVEETVEAEELATLTLLRRCRKYASIITNCRNRISSASRFRSVLAISWAGFRWVQESVLLDALLFSANAESPVDRTVVVNRFCAVGNKIPPIFQETKNVCHHYLINALYFAVFQGFLRKMVVERVFSFGRRICLVPRRGREPARP